MLQVVFVACRLQSLFVAPTVAAPQAQRLHIVMHKGLAQRPQVPSVYAPHVWHREGADAQWSPPSPAPSGHSSPSPWGLPPPPPPSAAAAVTVGAVASPFVAVPSPQFLVLFPQGSFQSPSTWEVARPQQPSRHRRLPPNPSGGSPGVLTQSRPSQPPGAGGFQAHPQPCHRHPRRRPERP